MKKWFVCRVSFALILFVNHEYYFIIINYRILNYVKCNSIKKKYYYYHYLLFLLIKTININEEANLNFFYIIWNYCIVFDHII